MKKIGLIGGVSPEATKIYYDLLNQHARERSGGQHSVRVQFAMLDYGVMIGHYHDQNWSAFTDEVVAAAEDLKAAGVQALAITSGTTHVAADAVAEATGLPVIHMLDSLTKAINAKASSRPLLLGTPWVMIGDYFLPALESRFGGNAMVPLRADRDSIGRIIFDELVNGIVTKASREDMIDLVKRYTERGADGVILGCTELCMILRDEDCGIPVFSTTHIHARAIDKHMHAK